MLYDHGDRRRIVGSLAYKLSDACAVTQVEGYAVVSEYDKRQEGRRYAPSISAEDHFPDSTSLADDADEEGSADACHHPVRPVEDGP